MNRSVVGASVAAVLVVGYVGASWGLGRMVHSGFDRWEQQLAKQPLPWLSIAERKYTPGVFSSVEEVTFELNRAFFDQLRKSGQRQQQEGDEPEEDEEDVAEPTRFTVRNEVKHGPLPGFTGIGSARIDSKIVWDAEMRAKLDGFLPGREPVEISTLLGLLGGLRSHITSPAFDFKDEKTTLGWQGFEGDFSVGRNRGSIGCDASSPGLSLYDADGAGAKVGAVKLACDGDLIFDELYDGTVNLEIASIEGSAKGGAEAMSMQKLSYSSDISSEGEYVDVTAKFGVGAISFMHNELSDVKYHLSLRHLHGPTYAALMRKMQSTTWSSMSGDPTASLAIAGAFGEYGPQLLEHSPQLVIDHIGFSSPEGEFGIKGSAELPGFRKDDLATAQSRAGLMSKVVANADVWISEELLNKDWSAQQAGLGNEETLRAEGDQQPSRAAALRQQIAAFEQQGFVTREDGQVRSHIEFKGGALTANGKQLR